MPKIDHKSEKNVKKWGTKIIQQEMGVSVGSMDCSTYGCGYTRTQKRSSATLKKKIVSLSSTKCMLQEFQHLFC